MYPIGGYVYIKSSSKTEWVWDDDKDDEGQQITTTAEHGPYKILAHFRLFKGSQMYYDLEKTEVHYRFEELYPASKDEDLYHKMTRHIEEY